MARKKIQNFRGIFFAEPNIDRAMYTAAPDFTVIYGTTKGVIAGLTSGFDGISMTEMNLWPESFVALNDRVCKNCLKEALVLQAKINKRTDDIFKPGQDFIPIMKETFNKLNPGIYVGDTRKPRTTFTCGCKSETCGCETDTCGCDKGIKLPIIGLAL